MAKGIVVDVGGNRGDREGKIKQAAMAHTFGFCVGNSEFMELRDRLLRDADWERNAQSVEEDFWNEVDEFVSKILLEGPEGPLGWLFWDLAI